MKWVATCDIQQCGTLTSVDSDEPLQPPFRLRNLKWCSVSSLTLIEYSSDKQRLWSDCAYAQADLRLCWSHIHVPYCWKSHVLAQIRISVCTTRRGGCFTSSPGGGGEEYSHFFLIRRLGSSIYCLPLKKISGISGIPKKYLKFSNLQNIFEFCSLTLRKSPKMFINDPQKIGQFCDDP